MTVRGTGKTTTMLQQALSTARAGNTVFVMGLDNPHCRMMMDMARHLPAMPAHAVFNLINLEIALWPEGQILFRTITDPMWDTKTKRMLGYPPGITVLLDHTVTEQPNPSPSVSRGLSSTKASRNSS